MKNISPLLVRDKIPSKFIDMTQKDQILKQQSDHYREYQKIRNNPRYRKAWTYILSKFKSGIVLDIGCTNGDFSKKLIESGFDCYGLEFMPEAIRESKDKGLKVTKGSFLSKFPFPDKKFNIVFAGEVVEHTIDDSYFLSECRRVLVRGGLLVLTTPNLVSLGNRILMSLGKLPRFAYADFHYRIYTLDLINTKLKEAKLSVVKSESNYILISTFFSRFIGTIGEYFGSKFPTLGENLIIYARRKS